MLTNCRICSALSHSNHCHVCGAYHVRSNDKAISFNRNGIEMVNGLKSPNAPEIDSEIAIEIAKNYFVLPRAGSVIRSLQGGRNVSTSHEE